MAAITDQTIGIVQQEIGGLMLEVWLLRQQVAMLESERLPVLEPLPEDVTARDVITGRRKAADTA